MPRGFDGFRPAALSFFRELAARQDRDWFQAHRSVYETEVRVPLGALVDTLSLAFAAHDIPLTGDAKRSLFHINRDVRFSKDKSPYKTNAGAVLSRDGTKTASGVLYIQIGGADGALMAAGFYGPEPDALAAIRQAIADAPERWLATEATLATAGLALSRDQALQRMPKGFEAHAGAPVADALKLKSFVVIRHIPDERLFEAALVDDILAFAMSGLPLLSFGRTAIQRGRRKD